MKKVIILLLACTVVIAAQCQTATQLKAMIDDSITNVTSPRTIKASNLGTRMKEMVDLSTNPVNIIQSSYYRFATDAEKSTWNGKQDLLGYTPVNVADSPTVYVSPKRLRDTASAIRSTIAGLSATYVSLTGSYANPSWITSLAAAKVTGLSTVATSGLFADLLSKPTTITGYGITIAAGDLPTGIDAAKINTGAVSNTVFNYLVGVTSAIQTQFSGKEPTITAGTTSQYWRGDKSWQTLDKTAVGLPNVDNTSDANKPVSTAQQTALDLKLNASAVSNTPIQYEPVAANKTGSTPTKYTTENLIELRTFTGLPPLTQAYWVDSGLVHMNASGLVDSIKDISGHNAHMVQTITGNKGTFILGFNNHPCISFSASALTNYSTGSATLTNLDSTYSIYYVVQRTSINDNQFMLGGVVVALNSGFMQMYNNGAATDSAAIQTSGCGVFEIHRKGRQIEYYWNGMKLKRYAHMTTYQLNFGLGTIGSSSGGFGYQGNVYGLFVSAGVMHNEGQRQQMRNRILRELGFADMASLIFGHSWTTGAALNSPNTGKISSAISTKTSYMEVGNGCSGTVLIKDFASPQPNNGYSNMDKIPRTMGKKACFTLLYMLNDARAIENGLSGGYAVYNAKNWKQQAATIAMNVRNKSGISISNILLLVESYTTFTATYTQARHDSFANYELDLARECGYRSLDLRTIFGTSIQTSGDGIHPNNNQCDTIANNWLYTMMADYTPPTITSFSGTYYVPVVGAVPYEFTGSSACAMPLPPVNDNAGYYIEVHNRGTATITFSAFATNDIDNGGTLGSTYDLTAGKSMKWYCDGTKWKVLAWQ